MKPVYKKVTKREIVAYLASDGKKFTDKIFCQIHEDKIRKTQLNLDLKKNGIFITFIDDEKDRVFQFLNSGTFSSYHFIFVKLQKVNRQVRKLASDYLRRHYFDKVGYDLMGIKQAGNWFIFKNKQDEKWYCLNSEQLKQGIKDRIRTLNQNCFSIDIDIDLLINKELEHGKKK